MWNQVIHFVVGEIALFLARINEFRNVMKSQAEFSIDLVVAGRNGAAFCAFYATGMAEAIVSNRRFSVEFLPIRNLSTHFDDPVAPEAKPRSRQPTLKVGHPAHL